MTTRRDIIEAARSLVGTPWARMGRRPGVGLDCAGVVVAVAAAVGYPVVDRAEYPLDGGDAVLDAMSASFDVIVSGDAAPGDVVLLRTDKAQTALPKHMGVVTETGGLIHMHYRVGRVVECTDASRYARRVVAVAKFRGVAPWQQ